MNHHVLEKSRRVVRSINTIETKLLTAELGDTLVLVRADVEPSSAGPTLVAIVRPCGRGFPSSSSLL